MTAALTLDIWEPERLETQVRRYPRITLDAPVHLAGSSGKVVVALVHDVSPDGFEVVCDRDTMREIVPPGGLGEGASAPLVMARLELPSSERTEELRVRGEVTYMKVVGNADFAIGVRFLAMSTASANALQGFIEESLMPC